MAKIETQPKTLSKRSENIALASFFGRLWGGVHDPVHLKRPFTMEHLPTLLKPSFASKFGEKGWLSLLCKIETKGVLKYPS